MKYLSIILGILISVSIFYLLPDSAHGHEFSLREDRTRIIECDYPEFVIGLTYETQDLALVGKGPFATCFRNELIDMFSAGPPYYGTDVPGGPLRVVRVYADGAREECVAGGPMAMFQTCTVFPPQRAPLTTNNSECSFQGEHLLTKSYAKRWNFEYEIADNEGLILKNIKIGNKKLLDSILVPHFKVEFADGHEKIIRYCTKTDGITEPRLLEIDSRKGVDGIRWSYYKQFEEGTLTIYYDFIVRHVPVTNCEFLENECLRLIPMINFKWKSNSPNCPWDADCILKKFTAFYKLDYGERTGLTLVGDYNQLAYPAGHQQFQQKEISFNAVNGGMEGEYDNIHHGHIGDYVTIPGCRIPSEYDCFHMHWRWGDIPAATILRIDPMVEPWNDETYPIHQRGEPYLVPGQTIDVAVVKATSDPSQRDPDVCYFCSL